MTSPLPRRPGRHEPAERRPATASPFLGRLVFPTGHGPRSIIVECLRADDGYTIHLPAFNEAGNYLADAPVSLTTVAETTDPAAVISGHSQQLADLDVGADAAEALERWSDGRPAHYFRITPVRPGAPARPSRTGTSRASTSLRVHPPVEPVGAPVPSDHLRSDGE